MYSIHGTRKLLDRVNQPVMPATSEPSTLLGNWYANVLFWRPRIALLANERTLLPVFLPLAPSVTLMERFPESLQRVLEAHGVAGEFINVEIGAMAEGRYAKTASRSMLGVMNEYKFLAEASRHHRPANDLVMLALELSQTPMGPLYGRRGSPDLELAALVTGWVDGIENRRNRPR